MEWKEAWDLISSGSISRKQRSNMKTLFWDAYYSGDLADLMEDDHARECYELLFKRKYNNYNKPDKLEKHEEHKKTELKTTTEEHKKLEIKTPDDFKYMFGLKDPVNYPTEDFIYDGVKIKLLDDDKVLLSVHNKEINREITVPKKLLDNIIKTEKTKHLGFKCALCGEYIKKSPDGMYRVRFGNFGIPYHDSCYEVIKHGLKYLVKAGGI